MEVTSSPLVAEDTAFSSFLSQLLLALVFVSFQNFIAIAVSPLLPFWSFQAVLAGFREEAEVNMYVQSGILNCKLQFIFWLFKDLG